MQNAYKVVFDLGQQSTAFDGEMIPLLILPAVGLLLVIVPQKTVDRILPNGPKGILGKLFALCFFGFTSFVAGSWLLSHNEQANALKSAEKAGRLSVIEGCLQHFHPMPETGHDEEQIEVGGQVFTYSDYIETTPAFNRTESHGGPIHADSKVRLAFSGNDIVRVEVQQKACPPAPEFPK